MKVANKLHVRRVFVKNAHLNMAPAPFPRTLTSYTPSLNTLLRVSPKKKKAVRENECRNDVKL